MTAKVAKTPNMVEQAKKETKEIVPRKMPEIPIGASCYFCLEEGLDDMGEPLLRDCSCRGDGAGFAHLSCMIKYADQKSKEAAGKDPKSFSEPWYECPNCKQCFNNELSLDMSSVDATGYSILMLEGWQPIVLVYNLVNED